MHNHMQSTVRRTQREDIWRELANGVHQGGAARLIDLPHPSEMACEVTFIDEVCKGGLVEQGREAVNTLTDAEEVLDQIWGDNDIPEPQGGKEHVTKAPHVDYAPIGVGTLQRSQRPAAIAKCSVIVTFDNPRIVTMRPVDKRDTSG